MRAVLAANSAMVMLDWEIGRAILVSQEKEGWGTKVVDGLSVDLKRAFPEMTGLGARNLLYMRQGAASWPDPSIAQRSAAQLPWRIHQALLDKIENPDLRVWYAEKVLEQGLSHDLLLSQTKPRLHEREGPSDEEFLPQLVARIPWGHNRTLIHKVKDCQEREWYARACIEHDWSRNVLEMQIETGLYRRQGEATTNFARTLKAPQADHVALEGGRLSWGGPAEKPPC